MATTLNQVRYAQLLSEAAPRVIRSDKELQQFTVMLLKLDERSRLSREERELADLLTTLIEQYEEKHHAIPKASPIEVLRFLMDQHGVSAKDLWPIVGSKGITSEVLNSKRGISVTVAGKLGEFFHVEPIVFIDWAPGKSS